MSERRSGRGFLATAPSHPWVEECRVFTEHSDSLRRPAHLAEELARQPGRTIEGISGCLAASGTTRMEWRVRLMTSGVSISPPANGHGMQAAKMFRKRGEVHLVFTVPAASPVIPTFPVAGMARRRAKA